MRDLPGHQYPAAGANCKDRHGLKSGNFAGLSSQDVDDSSLINKNIGFGLTEYGAFEARLRSHTHD